MKIKRLFAFHAAVTIAAGLGVCGCVKGGYSGPPEKHPFDPAKPVVFKDFSPKDGAVRTTVFINGDNFGTDPSRIRVTIGDKPAPIVGCNEKTIAVMVPRGAGAGEIAVQMLNGDGSAFGEPYIFADKMAITVSLQVNTLVGYKDPLKGETSVIDGSFKDAQFSAPWWLELARNREGQKVLLVHDAVTDNGGSLDKTDYYGNFTALRMVNLETKMVSTRITGLGSMIRQGLSMTMDPTRDTLFHTSDGGKSEWKDRHSMPAILYSLRSEDYSKARVYQYAQTCYSAVFFNDGSFYYNTFGNARLLRGRGEWDTVDRMWDGTPLFGMGAGGTWSGHNFMIKHPDELYVYVVGRNHQVRKVTYDKQLKDRDDAGRRLPNPDYNPKDASGNLLDPSKPQNDFKYLERMQHSGVTHLVAGAGSGYVEGTGSSAKFQFTKQGVFVKNEDYVKEGKEDVYDFYVCDQRNHCIRKVTPEGTTSLFAGRGSRGLDQSVSGWIDGDAIKTARFFEPTGIAYDPDTKIFYVADRRNKRIRTISVE